MNNRINNKQITYLPSSAMLIVCVALIVCLPVFAQVKTENADKDPNKGLPKGGVLSSSLTAGSQSKSVDVWSKKGAAVDAQPPISGSVSRASEKQWKMRVFNNTDDSFNADVKVKQINSRGDVIRTDSFSVRLKPKDSTERSIPALASSANSEMELVSWKRIVSAKPAISADSDTKNPVPEEKVLNNSDPISSIESNEDLVEKKIRK